MQNKQKALFTDGKGNIQLKELEKPKPGREELLVKVKAAAICTATDTHIIEGRHPGVLPFPTPLGHEAAGEAIEIGQNVKDFVSGDRIASVGWGGKSGGAFSTYLIVNPDEIVKIPDSISYEEASLLEISHCVYGIVDQCVRLGDTVLILGQGSAGLIATDLARAAGASKIFVSENSEIRKKLALERGADSVIDPHEDVVKRVKELTFGEGVDVVIECAGVPETIKITAEALKKGGIIGQFGACEELVPYNFFRLHTRHAKIVTVGSGHGYGKYSLERALRLRISGKINLQSLITHRFSLEEIDKGFEVLKNPAEEALKVIIRA